MHGIPSALAAPPTDPATDTLSVEVHIDFVCPWCLIGKRQLDDAVRRFQALLPDVRVETTWRSFELLPDTPIEGLCYETFYIRRLGSADAVALRRLQVKEAGRAAGVQFEFDRIRRLPNTARAHALLARAAALGTPAQQARLVDRVLTAFFSEGEDIGDPAVLRRLALACGLPESACVEAAPAVARIAATRRPDPDVAGVPFFVFDRASTLAGAASTASLLEALLGAWQERRARAILRP
jgi:predicted DsbA family dithiol-disulfide isomerase